MTTYVRRLGSTITLGALVCLLEAASCSAPAHAQTSGQAPGSPARAHEGSVWLGYMGDWLLRGPWSLWFDTHYNWETFLVVRGGLSHRFAAGPRITGGYAHLWLDPGDGSLRRNEHRPWAQVFFPLHVAADWDLSQRVRWDCRIRENVAEGKAVDGWTTTQRVRFQTAVSHYFRRLARGRPFVQAADEVLIDLGRHAGPNFLDQNRASLLFGFQAERLTVRFGYMDRFAPGISGNTPVHQHIALFWLNHAFDFTHALPTAIERPERVNP